MIKGTLATFLRAVKHIFKHQCCHSDTYMYAMFILKWE